MKMDLEAQKKKTTDAEKLITAARTNQMYLSSSFSLSLLTLAGRQ